MTKLILATLLFCVSCFQISAFAQGDFTTENPCLKKISSQLTEV